MIYEEQFRALGVGGLGVISFDSDALAKMKEMILRCSRVAALAWLESRLLYRGGCQSKYFRLGMWREDVVAGQIFKDVPEGQEFHPASRDIVKVKEALTSARKLGAPSYYCENSGVDDLLRMRKLSITTPATWKKTRTVLQRYVTEPTAEDRRKIRIRRMEEALLGCKIPGFFPTPRPVIDRMIQEANLQKGNQVLEPSAGKGDLAEAIREAGCEPVTVETVHSLVDILRAKGFTVMHESFLAFHSGHGQYDRILMNPPFEDGMDAVHVRHAYNLLAPGGRVVAIMSEGPFFRVDRASAEFREWLTSMKGRSEKLPAKSFASAHSFRQTSVGARLVVIDKLK